MTFSEARGVGLVLGDEILLDGSCHCVFGLTNGALVSLKLLLCCA